MAKESEVQGEEQGEKEKREKVIETMGGRVSERRT